MIQDMATVTMEEKQERVCDLSNGAISNNFLWSPNPDFKDVQLSQKLHKADIVTMEYYGNRNLKLPYSPM